MIFFDLDNTLLDHDGAEKDAICDFVAKYHSQLIELEHAPDVVWREITDKHRERWRQGELDFIGQRRARISELFSRPLTTQQADALFSEFFAIYQSYWRPYTDVIPALEKLKGIPLAVISNGFTSQQVAKLTETGLRPYFQLIVSSEEAGYAKPSPEIFHYAAGMAGGDANSHWFIGNHPERDAIAAHRAGMRSVWLNRDNTVFSTETRVVKSLTGFADLVCESYKMTA